MAERRMFAKSIIDTDAFLELPLSAQALYFHLSMRADDEGFVTKPKSIQRLIRASDDDFKLLIAKRYILAFDTGVIVIKHWKIHNYIRGDRIQKTNYRDERERLVIQDNGAYTEADGDKTIPIQSRILENTECPSSVSQMSDKCQADVSIGKDSIGKDSIDKDSIDKDSIIPPLPPIGEQTKYDFDKHTNLVNYQHIKDTMRDEYIDYIVNHTELDECVTTWMKYKDERKPKSSNHYAETGLIQLLNKIYKQCLNHGINNVLNIIEESMSNNYQGIIWNQIKTQNNSQTSVFDAWANA